VAPRDDAPRWHLLSSPFLRLDIAPVGARLGVDGAVEVSLAEPAHMSGTFLQRPVPMSSAPRSFSSVLVIAVSIGAFSSLVALGVAQQVVPELVADLAGAAHHTAGLLLARPGGQAAGIAPAQVNKPSPPASRGALAPRPPPPAAPAEAPEAPEVIASEPPEAAASAPPEVAAASAPAASASAPPAPVESALAIAPPPPPPPTLVPCGFALCAAGEFCCSPRCGLCVAQGEVCDQQACGYEASPSSAACGANTCNVGQVCCNASCGICAAPGATCSQSPCEGGPTTPVSQECGMSTCNVGSVCCDARCGLCAPVRDCARRQC
jgi:hypothetical protein